jgi:ketosteroid isomerase-like protein
MMAADGGDADCVCDPAVIAFNEAINRRDLDSLGELMTDDHAFIDSEDNVLTGKAEVLQAWRGFFNAFPDYRNDWSQVIPAGGTLIALGRSVCSTEPALAGPAIWRARTVRDKVAEWRVYDDTPANRGQLGIADESDFQ